MRFGVIFYYLIPTYGKHSRSLYQFCVSSAQQKKKQNLRVTNSSEREPIRGVAEFSNSTRPKGGGEKESMEVVEREVKIKLSRERDIN